MDTRTPQNTPANNAPISSRAQAPGVDSIKEGSCAHFTESMATLDSN